MPYKGLASLGIEEKCIKSWVSDLNPSTAKNYAYYLIRYIEYVKENGHWASAEEMLKDYQKLKPEKRFRHIDVLKQYVKSRKTGHKDKRNTWFAVRSFYQYHRASLPTIPKNEITRLYRPSEQDKRRALELAPLNLDEVRKLILNSPQPYRAAFMVIFQSAMGLAEFTQFNLKGWRKVLDNLNHPGPLRIDLYREKTSREGVKRYYTFIGEDGKSQIKEWLTRKPNTESDALFVSFNKNSKTWVPLNSQLIGNMITKVARRSGLIKANGLNRYPIHAHEFRDLFKSLCTLNGVHHVASEHFLGHEIDKQGYDKSPQYRIQKVRAQTEHTPHHRKSRRR
ncbi:MAG: hypothetical protein ACE5KO_05265 [Candidatus Bathyarchaeia archaeon]